MVAFFKFFFLETLELADQFSIGRIPQLHRAIITSSQKLLVVGAPSNAVDRGRLIHGDMGGDGLHRLSLGDIPDAEVAVVTARGQERARRIESHGINEVRMPKVLLGNI